METNFTDFWGEEKKKYQLMVLGHVRYTCVSIKPAHEVIESICNKFPEYMAEGIIYIVDKEGNLNPVHQTRIVKPSGKRLKVYVYDSEEGQHYNTITEASKKTGILYNDVYRQCKRNSQRTRFYYIKK